MPIAPLRHLSCVRQQLRHLREEQATICGPKDRAARPADLYDADSHLLVGIEWDFGLTMEQVSKIGKFRLELALDASVNLA